MKPVLILVAVLVLLTSLVRAEEIQKLRLEDASAISPRIEADSEVKVEGNSSIRITTDWPTTIHLGEVPGPDVENVRLVYAAKVKSEMEGAAFLEMWVEVDDGQFFARGLEDLVSQKTDWKPIQTAFVLKQGQKPAKVTLNLVINGKGTVWIDEAVLSTEPLE